MNIDDLTDLIAGGEDSFTQFKENLQDARRLAEELVAFSNAEGGQLIIGVSDDHQIKGLSPEDLHRLHQLISNTANENVKPPIYPLVQQFQVEEKRLLLVQVRKGSARPYATSSGVYLTKSGADKRRISPEELRRLFAESGGLSAEESLLTGSSLRDLNPESLQEFLRKRDLQVYEDLKAGRLDLNTICENLDLIRTGVLTLAGNLLFGREPQRFSKSFYVQCVHFDGDELGTTRFLSKDNFYGTIPTLYQQALNFLRSNLRRPQTSEGFNEQSALEIPEACLVEVLVNALLHRDYFINATIKIFIFEHRVEIRSPGKLPNSLSIPKIRSGLSIHRNPILSSLGQYLLPYSGLGSGIQRVERLYPRVEWVNDQEKEEFCATFQRTDYTSEVNS